MPDSQNLHHIAWESARPESILSVTLYVGAENWPFPVPLVSENGTWHFDQEAGKKEVLLRRIGEKHYKEEPGDPTNSSPTSLVGRAASGSAGGSSVLLDGYYFRLAPVQAGKASAAIALIAYPAQYRSTGVMTFAVLKNGVVYQKDLGANTTTVASGMTSFHKDANWRLAGE
jgi:hypothetical protein